MTPPVLAPHARSVPSSRIAWTLRLGGLLALGLLAPRTYAQPRPPAAATTAPTNPSVDAEVTRLRGAFPGVAITRVHRGAQSWGLWVRLANGTVYEVRWVHDDVFHWYTPRGRAVAAPVPSGPAATEPPRPVCVPAGSPCLTRVPCSRGVVVRRAEG